MTEPKTHYPADAVRATDTTCPGCDQVIYRHPSGTTECGGEGNGICEVVSYAQDRARDIRDAWQGDGPPPDDATCEDALTAHRNVADMRPAHRLVHVNETGDVDALRGALVALEQIAKRSSDQSSRVFAEGAAADLRARVPARVLDPNALRVTPESTQRFVDAVSEFSSAASEVFRAWDELIRQDPNAADAGDEYPEIQGDFEDFALAVSAWAESVRKRRAP